MMVENIGFPNYIVDDKLIDEEYKNVSENALFFQTQQGREKKWLQST